MADNNGRFGKTIKMVGGAQGIDTGMQNGPNYGKNIRDAVNSLNGVFDSQGAPPDMTVPANNIQVPSNYDPAARQKALGLNPGRYADQQSAQKSQQMQDAAMNADADRISAQMDAEAGNAPDKDLQAEAVRRKAALQNMLKKNNGYDY